MSDKHFQLLTADEWLFEESRNRMLKPPFASGGNTDALLLEVQSKR
jgi:hypothetical protein